MESIGISLGTVLTIVLMLFMFITTELINLYFIHSSYITKREEVELQKEIWRREWLKQELDNIHGARRSKESSAHDTHQMNEIPVDFPEWQHKPIDKI